MSESGSASHTQTTIHGPMDCLHRFTFEQLPVRGQWVRLRTGATMGQGQRAYPAPIHRLLNQMYAAVAMFADNLKFEGAVALQSRGDGALIRSLAECREQKYLRGIAHLNDAVQPPLQAADLAQWLNNGQLALSLIPPADSQQAPYQGLVPLQSDSLCANLEAYLHQSEQLPSRIFMAEAEDSVTGLLIQRLPSADKATEIALEAEADAWQTILTLADTVTPEELAGLAPTTLLRRLFAEYPCRLFPPRPLSFKCSCSREKSDRTLRTLGAEDLQALLEERGDIEVDCEFCGQCYRYDAVDIGHLIGGTAGATQPGPLH